MSATKPIAPGDWVLWYGLWKVLTVGDECIPKQYTKGTWQVRPHGKQVATLEPLNVKNCYIDWYQNDVKYHGGIPVKSLIRINPLSALKRTLPQMNWTQQFVVNVSDDVSLKVTQTKHGWHWEGNDHMAWQPQECWGEGTARTLNDAKQAAEYWLSTGRFMKTYPDVLTRKKS